MATDLTFPLRRSVQVAQETGELPRVEAAMLRTAGAMHAVARVQHGIALLTKAEALAICREMDFHIEAEVEGMSPLETALLKLRAYCDWPACVDETLSEAEEHDEQFRTFVLARGAE